MFQQMTYIDAHINFISVTCSPRNAKVTIGRYRLLAKWPIIGQYRLLADYRSISTVNDIIFVYFRFSTVLCASMQFPLYKCFTDEYNIT